MRTSLCATMVRLPTSGGIPSTPLQRLRQAIHNHQHYHYLYISCQHLEGSRLHHCRDYGRPFTTISIIIIFILAANIWRDPVYTIAETMAGHSQPLALSLSLYQLPTSGGIPSIHHCRDYGRPFTTIIIIIIFILAANIWRDPVRVGHSVLFRSESSVLFCSKQKTLRSFLFFSRVFGDL